MILQSKTLEKLRLLINEETEYRKGPKLVSFFNELGFNDSYGDGFPSRWAYTDDRLSKINGTPEIDKCIKKLFAPINFIGRFDELDIHISAFNEYLAFDKWKVVRQGTEINFAPADKITFTSTKSTNLDSEDDFLNKDFNEVSIAAIGLDASVTVVLELRIAEIKKCMLANSPLSVIFMCGSTLEGILLGLAIQHPRTFNTAVTTPKDHESNKPKPFPAWSLNNLIDVACETGFLKQDVKKFSHSLRDFRNYIHPYEQMNSGFNPDKHTAGISWQVLKAAVFQISNAQKLKATSK
ncbi:hypothetical protein [Sphingobacterium hotanense]|uniref:hypothetical protein n=1 Tax=Sphingobacterium hotanense TaxID=649196 RepID=UPI0011F3D006|nr:hypothetical protein [Sphingobacterium hotanense]